MILSSVPAVLLRSAAPIFVALMPLSVVHGVLVVQGPTPVGDPAPVFRIDDELVPVDEYGQWISEVMGPIEAYNYARIHLVGREAERLGVEVTEAEVGEKVEGEIQTRVENAFHGNKEGWLEELERIGRSEGEYRRARSVEIRPWLVATRLADIDREIPQAKVIRDWERIYGPGGRQYDLRLMLFKVVMEMPPEGTPQPVRNLERERRKHARLQEALAVRELLLSGGDFAELALRYSDDRATRENGGRLPGGFSHFGWPTAFIEALAQLSPGDLSEPLYAKGGWFLVEVASVEETPLADVEEELVAGLVARGPESDEVAVVEQRLMKGVEVEVLPALFEPHKKGEFPDAFEPVLNVGDDVVRRGEYALWLMHTHGGSYANRYIEDRLVERKANELGVVVTDEDVRSRVREYLNYRIDNAYRGSREAFTAYLEASQMTEEQYARRFAWRARSDLFVERLIRLEREISPDELRLAWIDHYGPEGVGQEVRGLAVAVELPELPENLDPEAFDKILTRAGEEARQRAVKVVSRIENGEDFESIAERYGTEVTPDGLAAVPSRFQPETWLPEISEVVTALAPGEVSEPIRYGALWLVFECLGVRKVAFEDVRDALETELINARPASIQIATYRNVLLKQADIEILPALYE